MQNNQKKVILAVTGASGTAIARVILTDLLKNSVQPTIIISNWAEEVAQHETGQSWDEWLKNQDKSIRREDWQNMASVVSSGSSYYDGMIVAPCSMGTLGGIAAGISRNLIERAADVSLKERRPLVLVPREAPFSRIHLSNMLSLTDAGAVILPPTLSFYHNPSTIDDILHQISARVLKALNIRSETLNSWAGVSESEEP